MHSLLKRQIRRCFGDQLRVPEGCEEFISAVNTAYREFDADREMLERALELSSQELLQANSEMRAIFQAMPDLLFRLDGQGTILGYEAGGTTHFFLQPQELLGKRIQDIRVSVVPSLHGEKVVLRLLRKTTTQITLEDLGMDLCQLEMYKSGVRKSHGIILISGPTGSGKTTTLYATLNLLNDKEVNILTIEDPVEYTIDGITQVHLREDIGLSFSKALRTFLRQDPDIIMLGEIRDNETAQMAIRAALTGHLVLSTIHTNSAWGIVTRLHDMGIQPFLLASTLNMAVAQRLVRKLCPQCKEEVISGGNDCISRTRFTIPERYYKPVGCPSCNYTGYSGRIAVFEIIEICEELREAIKASKTEINEYLSSKGIPKIPASAYNLFRRGETSLDEVYPILSTDY